MSALLASSLATILMAAPPFAEPITNPNTQKKGWSGEGQAGFSMTTGNTDETALLLAGKLIYQGEEFSHTFQVLVDYRDSQDVATARKYSASYQPNWDFSEDFYSYLFLGWERDQFTGFEHRYTGSLGIGYHAIAKKKTQLDVEGGLAGRFTEFVPTYVTQDDESEIAFRMRAHFQHELNEHVTLSQDLVTTLGSENSSANSISAISTRLFESVALRASYEVKYESDPLPGLVSTDTATRISVVYGF